MTAKLAEDEQTDLLRIYEFDEKLVNELMDEYERGVSPKLHEVVDCVVHGLTAEHPERVYKPGWTMFIKLISISPWWVKEKLSAIALILY